MSDGRVVIDILGDDSDFKRAVGGLGSSLNQGLKNAAIVGGVFTGIAATIAGIAIKGGIERALAIDTAKGKLKGLGYDMKSIEVISANALAAVKGTAFGLGDAMTVAASAMASGVKEGADLERYLRGVADAAFIAGADLGDMGQVFNKVQATGKVTGETLRELGGRGVPILEWLAKEYGVTAAEMTKMVSKGVVDSKTFRKAIEDNIGGAALAADETIEGSAANMKAALSRVGEALVGGGMGKLPGLFHSITDGLDRLTPIVKEAGDALGAFIGSIDFSAIDPTIFWVLGGVIGGFVVAALLAAAKAALAFIAPMLPIVAVAAAVGIALKLLIDSLGGWKATIERLRPAMDWLRDVWNGIRDALGAFMAGLRGDMDAIEGIDPSRFPIMRFGIDVANAFGAAKDAAKSLWENIKSVMGPVIETLGESLGKLKESMGPALDSLRNAWEQLKPALTTIGQIVGGVIVVAFGLLVGVINGVINAIGPLIEAIGGIIAIVSGVFNLIVGIVTGDGEKIKEAVAGIGQGILDVFGGLWGAVSGLLTGFIDGVVTFFSGLYDTLVGHSIVPDMINGIIAWFAGLPGKVAGAIATFVTNVIAKFNEVRSRVVSSVSGLVGDVVSWFAGLPGKLMAGLGTLVSTVRGKFDEVTGVVLGLPDKFRQMKDRVVGFITSLLSSLRGPIDSIKGLLNNLNPFARHSPSLVDNVLAGTQRIRDLYEGLSGMQLDSPEFVGATAYSPAFSTGPASGALAAGGVTNYYQFGDVTIPGDDAEAQAVISDLMSLMRRYQRMGPRG